MSLENRTSPATSADAPANAPHHRRRGAEIRSKIADSTIVQGTIAGALSFTHIRDVALMGGQTGWKGWAYPLIVDMITVSAYRRLKRNQAAGESTGLPWTWLIIATVASLSANIIDAIVHAPSHAGGAQLALCIVVGVWPAVAFFGSMLLRHSDKPASRPAIVEKPTPAKPTGQPVRPVAPIVHQAPSVQPAAAMPPIPVQPTGRPQPLGDLGPRAAVGELPMPVWVEIGRPVYQQIKTESGDRPTEKMLQAALTKKVGELIAGGKLPAAVAQPSGSTAKRIRRAIEQQHPELTARVDQPRRLAITSA